MLCPIKVNSNTIELIVHTSCYCILDLLCDYNLLTTLKVLPALLGGYVFQNTKGSRIVRILLCLKNDLKPELGTGLPGRWRLRPTLPGSRVTRRATRLATLAWRKWRSRKKNLNNLDV